LNEIEDRLIYRSPASPYSRSAQRGVTAPFIDSAVRRALTQDIVRFARGELNGRSYLISGHRGAGKTTLSLVSIEQACTELRREGLPTRPMLVRLHGPSLLDPEHLGTMEPDEPALLEAEAPTRPALEPKQLTDVLIRVTTELYHAVSTEFVERLHDAVDGPDLTELAEQLRIDLHGAPRLGRLRDLFRRADVLERGVLFPKAPGEARGAREIATLWSASRAYMRVTGNLSAQLTEKEGDHVERSASSLDPKAFALGAQDNHPLFAAALAMLTGFGLTAADYPITGVISGLLTGLVALGTLDARTSRKQELAYDASETFKPDTTAHSLVRLLPRLVRELRDIGLAPVFVVDELDKVPDLRRRLETLIAFLKSVVADETFFCFITDRAYYADLQREGRDKAYAAAHTWFSQRAYIVYSPLELRRFVGEVVTADPNPRTAADLTRTRQIEQAIALVAYTTVLRAYGHPFDLRAELARATGGTDQLLESVRQVRLDRRRHREAAVAIAMELVLLDEHAQARVTDPHLAQVLIDALYLPVRRWFDGDCWFCIEPEGLERQLRQRVDSQRWCLAWEQLAFVHERVRAFVELLHDLDGLQERVRVLATVQLKTPGEERRDEALRAQLAALDAIGNLASISRDKGELVVPAPPDGTWPVGTWLWTIRPDGDPVDLDALAREYRRTHGEASEEAARPAPAASPAEAAPPPVRQAAPSASTTPAPVTPTRWVRVIGAADGGDLVLRLATRVGVLLAERGVGLVTNGTGQSDDAVRRAYLDARRPDRPWGIRTTVVAPQQTTVISDEEQRLHYRDIPAARSPQATAFWGDLIVLLQAGRSAEQYVSAARGHGVPVLPVPTSGDLPREVWLRTLNNWPQEAPPGVDRRTYEALGHHDRADLAAALDLALQGQSTGQREPPISQILDLIARYVRSLDQLGNERLTPQLLADRHGLMPPSPSWCDVTDAIGRLRTDAARPRAAEDEALVRAWWREAEVHVGAVSLALGAAHALVDLDGRTEPGSVANMLGRLVEVWPPEAPGTYHGAHRTFQSWRALQRPLALIVPSEPALDAFLDGRLPAPSTPVRLEHLTDEAVERWRRRLVDQLTRQTTPARDGLDAIEHALGLPTAQLPLVPTDALGWSRATWRAAPFCVFNPAPLPTWVSVAALLHLGLPDAAVDLADQELEHLRAQEASTELRSLHDDLVRLRDHGRAAPRARGVLVVLLNEALVEGLSIARGIWPILVLPTGPSPPWPHPDAVRAVLSRSEPVSQVALVPVGSDHSTPMPYGPAPVTFVEVTPAEVLQGDALARRAGLAVG
jgi:hypothetical protein